MPLEGALTYLCSLLCQDRLLCCVLLANIAASVERSHQVANVPQGPAKALQDVRSRRAL